MSFNDLFLAGKDAPQPYRDFLRFQGTDLENSWVPLVALKIRKTHILRSSQAVAYAQEALDELAREADRFEADGIFTTVNPIKSGVASKCDPNVWVAAANGTSTQDDAIACRKLIMIDFDASRQSGSSATYAELKTAVNVAQAAYAELAERVGENSLAVGMSGNGAHLYLAVDLLNSAESDELVKQFLALVAAKYNSEAVNIDMTVGNAARLCPLFGTMKRKGGQYPKDQRVHRRSFFAAPADVKRLDQVEFGALVKALNESLTLEQNVTLEALLKKRDAKQAQQALRIGAKSPVWNAIGSLPIVDVAAKLGLDVDHPTCPKCGQVGSPSNSSVKYLVDRNVLKCQHNTCGSFVANPVKLISITLCGVESVAKSPESARKVLDWARENFGIVEAKGGGFATPKEIPSDHTGEGITLDSTQDAVEAFLDTQQAEPDFAYSDDGNMHRFLAKFGDSIMYTPAWKKWFTWSDLGWEEDRGGAQITRWVQETVREIKDEADRAQSESAHKKIFGWYEKSGNVGRIEGVVKLARSNRIVDESLLDADPWLLGLANGVLDLKTGLFRAARKTDYSTKRSAVSYDPTAKCPNFEAFLASSQPDPSIRGYLQRHSGYCLTGSVKDQCLVIHYGSQGRNGKGVFNRILQYVLGSYAISAPKSLLIKQRFEQHPTDVASLAGRRLAVASETAQTDTLDTALVKNLTGGDLISARRMHEDFHTFSPTHKIVLQTNHLARIIETTNAMWSRIHLVPWLRSFSESEQDKDLDAKLRAEASGILNWLIAGCLEWQRIGLAVPPIMLKAAAEYRESEDVIGQFIADCTAKKEGSTLPNEDIRAAYEAWSKDRGDEYLLNGLKFKQALLEHGFEAARPFKKDGKTCRGFIGVVLKDVAERDARRAEMIRSEPTVSELIAAFETETKGGASDTTAKHVVKRIVIERGVWNPTVTRIIDWRRDYLQDDDDPDDEDIRVIGEVEVEVENQGSEKGAVLQ